MNNDNQETLNKSLTSLTINDSSSSSQETTNSNPISEKIEQKMENKPEGTKKKQVTRNLPVHNVPEKIILCLDTCIEQDYTPFKSGEDTNHSPLSMLKRVIEFYVNNKHFIDPKHEYALLALEKQSVKWLQEFTNLPREIIKPLNEVDVKCEYDEEYDLSVLLEEIWRTVSIPKNEKDLSIPPPFVVRLILLYSRSYSVPVVKKPFKELLENPYFIIDVISTHDENLEESKLREIFNHLQIDKKGYSYNFCIGRNAKLLHEAMAKLLAHPLQRPFQSDIQSYAAPVFEKDE